MKARRIRTKPDKSVLDYSGFSIAGWLNNADSGKCTYLWFGVNDRCVGTLSGRKLYRLCKAVVRRFEEGKD